MKLAQIAVVTLAILVVQSAAAQQPSTRIGALVTVGTESGLGYKLPYTDFGVGVEHDLGHHLEVSASADWSPTHKYVTNDGNAVRVSAQAIAWTGDHFGLTAGDDEAWLWTSQFAKHANHPSVGIVTRLWWLGFPSRFYASYLVPVGARPTDGSLQSNRLQGVSAAIEAQGWSRVRMTTKLDILTLLDQSGAAPGLRHWEGTVVVTFRIGTKQDLNALY